MDLDFLFRRTMEAPPPQRLNAAKQALQETILAALSLQGGLEDLVFQGGTALRFVHQLPRYSEDLDFLWKGGAGARERVAEWSGVIARHAGRMGLFPHLSHRIEPVKARVPKEVATIFLSGTAPRLASVIRGELRVKLEIDLNPPQGYEAENRLTLLANNPVPLPVLNLPSLMAGKLHILLTRRDREKGRDWYDYFWYRMRETEPNRGQLQAAVDQTNEGMPARYWMSLVRHRLRATDWRQIQDDVRPFLEQRAEADLLTEHRLDDLTPRPDFGALLSELRTGRQPEELWGAAASAIREDIASAALSGDESAIGVDRAWDDRFRPRGGPLARQPEPF